MKIAYVILAHKQPELLERMFNSIYRPGNYYIIHIDKKSNQYFNKNIQLLNSYKNVYFIDSVSCAWGSFAIVKAQLEGIKKALQTGPWDFVINLSGQDFPLKSQENIINELKVFKSHNLVNIIDQQNDWPQSLYRIGNYHLVLGNRLINTRISVLYQRSLSHSPVHNGLF